MEHRPEPASPSELPSGTTLRERLAALPQERRRVLVRSVRRGERVADARDAELAVALARRQQRMLQLSWLIVPLGGFLAWLFIDLQPTMLVAATVVAGYLAILSLARVVRAERLNRAVIATGSEQPTGTQTGDAGGGPPSGGGTSHLPQRRR